MKENYIVTQGNDLIEARHNKPLTAREQKIVLTMVSVIQPSDEDFKEYRISLKNFSEMLGLKGSTKYGEIKNIVKDLMEKTIEIPRKGGGWLLSHWVSSAEYIDGEGIIELTFSPKLKPYLLQLKNQFTSYRLSNVLSLNSTYSIRLYELLKKWQHLGRWESSVGDLRMKLGVGEGIYPRYANLKARVLITAIEEVNEKTDLNIGFIEIKKGRSVERIEFTIRHAPEKEIRLPESKKKPEQLKRSAEYEDERTRLNALVKGYSFDHTYFADMYKVALQIWNDNAENELKMLIQYVNEEENVKNPLGFIKSKLKEAWEFYQAEFSITFANLKTSQRRTERIENVPDWFNNRDEKKEEVELTEELIEKKRELLAKIGLSPEEIEKKL